MLTFPSDNMRILALLFSIFNFLHSWICRTREVNLKVLKIPEIEQKVNLDGIFVHVFYLEPVTFLNLLHAFFLSFSEIGLLFIWYKALD